MNIQQINSYFSLWTIAIFSFCLAACDGSNEELPPATTPLSIQVGVASHTRAAFVDRTFSVGTQIGVALIKDPDATGTSIYNKSSFYTLNVNTPNEIWSVNSGINGLFVSGLNARAIAYYPVGANNILTMNEADSYITPSLLETNDMGDLSKYSIGGGLGVQFGEEIVKISPYETDYLVGKSIAVANSTSPTVSLEMKHALAMVSVRIIRDASYYGEGRLTAFTIANKADESKPLRKGAIRLLTNSFVPGVTEISYTRTFSHYTVEENSDYNDRVGFLAFPAAIPASTLAISLVVDGKNYTSATNSETLTFEAGKLTRLTITVKATEILLNSSILVEDWIDTSEHGFEVD